MLRGTIIFALLTLQTLAGCKARQQVGDQDESTVSGWFDDGCNNYNRCAAEFGPKYYKSKFEGLTICQISETDAFGVNSPLEMPPGAVGRTYYKCPSCLKDKERCEESRRFEGGYPPEDSKRH